jgi:hypothetical protein
MLMVGFAGRLNGEAGAAGLEETLISGTTGGRGVVFRLGTSGARATVGRMGAVAACERGGGPDFVGFKGLGFKSGMADTSSFSSTTFQFF